MMPGEEAEGEEAEGEDAEQETHAVTSSVARVDHGSGTPATA